MFEGSLITYLAADSALVALLSTYKSAPAIFSNVAPQKAEKPYIVFDINEYETENLAASGFDIDFEIIDFVGSAKTVRGIAERIKFICDHNCITGDARFDTIRMYRQSGREIELKDIEKRKYIFSMTARAGRKKWAEETL